MTHERSVDALCPICDDVQAHRMVDAGSCRCDVCGNVQQMVTPLA